MAEREMTLRDHLEELRRRLFIVLAFIVLATAAAFFFRERLFDFLLAPGFGDLDEQPIATEVLETVGVTFKVALMAAFAVSLPVALYQAIMFASPGLTRRERLYAFLFLPAVLGSFAAGVAFGYYVLFPPAFAFLFNFAADVVNPEIRISSYVNVITSLMFWMGVVFQIPVALFALGRLGVVSPRWLARRWRYAVLPGVRARRDHHPDVRPGESNARRRADHRAVPRRHTPGAPRRAAPPRRPSEARRPSAKRPRTGKAAPHLPKTRVLASPSATPPRAPPSV